MKSTLIFSFAVLFQVSLMVVSPNTCTAQFNLSKQVISGGGGITKDNEYNVKSTLGQVLTGKFLGPLNIAHIGFWFEGELVIDTDEPESTTLSNLLVYPNPTNFVATVAFKTDRNIHISIKLYAIGGGVVLTVTDEKFSPGNHLLPFSLEKLASGTYICLFQSDDVLQARLVSIIR